MDWKQCCLSASIVSCKINIRHRQTQTINFSSVFAKRVLPSQTLSRTVRVGRTRWTRKPRSHTAWRCAIRHMQKIHRVLISAARLVPRMCIKDVGKAPRGSRRRTKASISRNRYHVTGVQYAHVTVLLTSHTAGRRRLPVCRYCQLRMRLVMDGRKSRTACSMEHAVTVTKHTKPRMQSCLQCSSLYQFYYDKCLGKVAVRSYYNLR